MKNFIIVVSKDHAERGKQAGFVQSGHGNKFFLNRMSKGDHVIFYASKKKNGDTKPYQKFTAIAKIMDDEPFQTEVSDTFKPWRRKAEYVKTSDQDIQPLIDKLNFIPLKNKWGHPLMSGFVEIGQEDFELIASNMEVSES
ncbi:EVE domain-containing protein [Fulvivirga ligni]|uniref:EVE domain-containing protein n=1 Tax=Fulvivirga ligni TaxID=2904246 RepID=UPI001F436C09|nr:EVE domain-containing protein [Fulvivirga ligni]UII23431.1 EVE domain-containing protein [Fulvivirga ligni]